MASRPVLNLDTINPNLKAAKYAVRGGIVAAAVKVEAKLKEQQAAEEANAEKPAKRQKVEGGSRYAFECMIKGNLGNPQALGQRPLRYNRQILSLYANPELLSEENAEGLGALYPPDVIERAREMIKHTTVCNGAYTESKGYSFVREHVADYISQRDGADLGRPDVKDIVLTNGASQGVSIMLEALVTGRQDGVMVPIPQYPLYSATLTKLNGTQVDYYLDESAQWGLDMGALRGSYEAARKGDPNLAIKALVVINPGNPTGAVLTGQNIRDVIEFAHEKGLVILADEVYQENDYLPDLPFISFRKVLLSMGDKYKDQELVSFHSTSKGIAAECGLRGGYMEWINMDSGAQSQLEKACSICLCPNVVGQIAVDLMVRTPKEGEASYSSFKGEYDTTKKSLKERADKLVAALNALEGVQCQPVQGAMYVFPSITLPDSVAELARANDMAPDFLYCLALLHKTGIIVVPGCGFGQREGTYHFRSTFLPPVDQIDKYCASLAEFHTDFIANPFCPQS